MSCKSDCFSGRAVIAGGRRMGREEHTVEGLLFLMFGSSLERVNCK